MLSLVEFPKPKEDRADIREALLLAFKEADGALGTLAGAMSIIWDEDGEVCAYRVTLEGNTIPEAVLPAFAKSAQDEIEETDEESTDDQAG